MALQIIGSGFGRTGTMSTKMALEQLGFGPCHHMIEVIEKPNQPQYWKAIGAGAKVPLADVFEGYNSQVDWPGAAIWRETSVAFPNAKVLHTERPEDEWWNSFNVTIGKFFSRSPEEMSLPPHIADIFQTMSGWFMKNTFADHTDRTCAISAYRRNNEEVRDTIPADRLLVFNVAEGWDPLCRFLEKPAPATPFPRSNPRDEFWAHFGGEPA
jgi:hypothetical protein